MIEHDLDTYHWYLLAGRAMLRLRQGSLGCGGDGDPPASPAADALVGDADVALTPLGQLCARRGNAEAGVALDEALTLAERTGNFRAWVRSAPRAPRRLSRR